MALRAGVGILRKLDSTLPRSSEAWGWGRGAGPRVATVTGHSPLGSMAMSGRAVPTGPDPKSLLFENPKAPLDGLVEKQPGQSGSRTSDCFESLIPEPQNHNARGGLRRMPTNVTEVDVESHQCASFSNRRFQNAVVILTGELFFASEGDIVSGAAQDAGDQIGYVLVELDERHGYAGTGTIRSRARSAT